MLLTVILAIKPTLNEGRVAGRDFARRAARKGVVGPEEESIPIVGIGAKLIRAALFRNKVSSPNEGKVVGIVSDASGCLFLVVEVWELGIRAEILVS